MEMIGKIKFVGDMKVVVSATTGNEFKFRQMILTVKESYYTADGQKMVSDNDFLFDLTYERAENFNIPLGTMVKVGYASKVTQGGSNLFGRMRIYSIQEVSQ